MYCIILNIDSKGSYASPASYPHKTKQGCICYRTIRHLDPGSPASHPRKGIHGHAYIYIYRKRNARVRCLDLSALRAFYRAPPSMKRGVTLLGMAVVEKEGKRIISKEGRKEGSKESGYRGRKE